MIEVFRVSSPIVIAGDPHGNFSPILRACAAQKPGTLILLGRLRTARAAAPDAWLRCSRWAGDVRWILGNKDAETETVFDKLATDFPRATSAAR